MLSNQTGQPMRTTLFNLHEINLGDENLIIEFYAGDIFDIYTDILVLSAFRGGFDPVPGTTWGSLARRIGHLFFELVEGATERISGQIVAFPRVQNPHFGRMFALEMAEVRQQNSFTLATLKSRYREMGQFLENCPDENVSCVSLPLPGTGNQRIDLADSVTELLLMLSSLKQTKLRVIRVFAHNFESVGVLNRKINALLHRREAGPSHLLEAALREIQALRTGSLTAISLEVSDKMIALSAAQNNSLDAFGLAGRHFAEKVTTHWLKNLGTDEIPSTLHSKIQLLSAWLLTVRPYVYSYLRLLQNYGNQVSHYGNNGLTHQDAAAVIIAIARIIDFHENRSSNY